MSTVLEELPETHPDYMQAVKLTTNCWVILEYNLWPVEVAMHHPEIQGNVFDPTQRPAFLNRE